MSPSNRERSGGSRLNHWLYPYHGSHERRPWQDLAPQVALIATAFIAYFMVRGLTKGAEDLAVTHALDLLTFEKSLGVDWESGAQQLIVDKPTWTKLFNTIYVWGYWPPLIGALAYFWARDRREFTVLRDVLFISGAVGLVVFAVYPVAPPRFLEGFTDTIADSRRGMFLAQPPGFVNKFAALPSFHVGWLALAGAVAYRHLAARWRLLAFAPMLAMSAAVVFTANHYLVDIVIGVTFSLAALALARRVHQPTAVLATSQIVPRRPTAPVATQRRRDLT